MYLASKLVFSLILISLFFVLIEGENADHIKIGAFNVQVFGVKKAANPDIMQYIIKIIQRYDLILIQEIRDKSQTVMYKVLKRLQEAGTEYKMHISKRLGRTSSKEQYAFLYRIGSGISVEDSFTFDDGSEANKTDTFQREPFVVRFSFNNLPFKYINFIAIHVEPGTAVAELRHLMDVYEETVKRWKNNDVIILGDLNADCSYVPKSKWSSIPLRSDHYYWPIGDADDTTITKSNCAYDRFVIAGNRLINLAKSGQVAVFKFDEFYGLNYTMARLISDHYPIELDLPIHENNEISSSSKSERMHAVLKYLLLSTCGQKALEEAHLSEKDFKILADVTDNEYIDTISENDA